MASESTRAPRGPSSASKAAERYLSKYPATPAKELAARFKIDITTVYRSSWWQQRKPAP